MIIPSAKYRQYEKNASVLLDVPDSPINVPCHVRYLYYMQYRRNVDLSNLTEATDDLLVSLGILRDDYAGIIVSHDGSRVLYDH